MIRLSPRHGTHLGVALSTFSASTALAQEDAAADRSEAFQTVEGAVQEDVPGGPLLVGAYALILAALLAYVIRLVRLQGKMRDDIARLERAMDTPDTGGEG